MIFKNPQDSAQKLASKIKEEQLNEPVLFTYIDPDSASYVDLFSLVLPWKAELLEDILFKENLSTYKSILILDNGETRASEYSEFILKLRHDYPTLEIIIAVPFIPESEESLFKNNCDRLITLHIEPYFFSINQFYSETE